MTMLHLLSLRAPVLLLAVVAAPLSAQLRWVDAAPSQSPAPRYGHVAGSSYVMFGGRDNVQVFGDTWSYGVDALLGGTWTPVPTPIHPSARYDHEAASLVGGMLIFGGRDSSGSRLADTWLLAGGWVPSTPSVWLGGWQQQQTAVAPTARTGHAMAYDMMTNTECVLFGGRTDTGLSNETWRFWNGQWQQLFPTVSPSAREGHVMEAGWYGWILFGGEDSSGVSSESWQFDGSNWVQLADMPFAAADAAVVRVPFERNRFTFVGGRDGSGQLRDGVFERSQDAAWFDQDASNELARRQDAVVLEHLHFAAGSPNQWRATALAFGGRDAFGNALGDTMRLEPTNVAYSQQISTGCGPGAWGNNGPDLFMQSLLLGGTRDLNVYTQSENTPVFVGAEFGEVTTALPCQIGINPNVILFNMATAPISPASFGKAVFPIHAPFHPALRGAVLSFQALAFDAASASGISLSGVFVVHLGD